MRTYLKVIPAKFHPDPIWNDGDLGIFEEVAPTSSYRITETAVCQLGIEEGLIKAVWGLPQQEQEEQQS